MWVYTHSYGIFFIKKNLIFRSPYLDLFGGAPVAYCIDKDGVVIAYWDSGVAISYGNKTPSTLLHVLGVVYVKREEMTL